MKRLVLALAAATMVALSVPANAQRIYVGGDTPWAAGPKYYYDSADNTYYGGFSPPYAKVYVVTPRARTYVYDAPPDRYGHSRAWDAAARAAGDRRARRAPCRLSELGWSLCHVRRRVSLPRLVARMVGSIAQRRGVWCRTDGPRAS